MKSRGKDGRRGRRRREERGALSLQNEGPTPQDGLGNGGREQCEKEEGLEEEDGGQKEYYVIQSSWAAAEVH